MELKNNQTQEAIQLANQKLVRSWSSVKYIVDGTDALAEMIKNETGSHCDRSKLLNALAEIAIDCKLEIDTTNIKNHETLKAALVKALKKHK